tara:strand:- start:335 stop:541 length:207 start_codon:yes stop_codon:yes gene_type:complete
MKIALRLSFFLFALLTIGEKSFSLTDYQIKKICKKEIRVSTCIKNIKEKRFNLKQGNSIEIPVIPYKR